MNKNDRKKIEAVIVFLNELRDTVSDMAEKESEKYDNLPDTIQESSRGEAISDAADALGDAVSYIEDAIGTLEAVF